MVEALRFMKSDWIEVFCPNCLTKRLRFACVLTVILIPLNAVAQENESERWKQVRDCKDLISVEMFLLDYPDSQHADDARNCLAGVQNGDIVERDPMVRPPLGAVLRTCDEHLAANRLTTGHGGTAFDCYNDVLSEYPDNQDARDGLRKIADRYAGWANEAIGACDKLGRAQSHLDRLVRVDSEDERISGILLALADKREECRTSSWGIDTADDLGSMSPVPVDETAAHERFGPDWSIVENQLCQVWNRGEPENYEPVTWSGSCVDGKVSGEGQLTGRAASTEEWHFEGSMHFGKAHGLGVFVTADGSRYEGAFRDDDFHGYGTYTWADGRRYEGEWRNNIQHGHGVFSWTDGSHYEGEFRDGARTGYGTYVWADGNRYDGMNRDGLLHGHGVLIWTDGSRYEGEFRNDARTGYGTYIWADGNRYDGMFRDGLLHGRGALTWTDGSRYEGDFRDDARTGFGTYFGADGSRYDGSFRDGQLHGHGVLTWKDGSRYDGEWHEGKQHGRGTVTWTDGTNKTCRWEFGNEVAGTCRFN